MESIMETEVESIAKKYRSVIQRYYKQFYSTNANDKKREDHCILQHSNKICVVTIAPRHPIRQNKVTKIDFQISKNTNRLQNQVVGKRKRGGQFLETSSPLCIVTCDNGEQYTILSCVKGKLVEINEELISNPTLLNDKPDTEGFIAIVMPKLQNNDQVEKTLMNAEDYKFSLEDDEQK